LVARGIYFLLYVSKIHFPYRARATKAAATTTPSPNSGLPAAFAGVSELEPAAPVAAVAGGVVISPEPLPDDAVEPESLVRALQIWEESCVTAARDTYVSYI
jgi:hypothetical protein